MDVNIIRPVQIFSGGIIICSIWLWYLCQRNKPTYKIGLTYKSNKRNCYVIENCKSLTNHFKPAFIFSNGHVQTLIGAFVKPVPLKSKREYLNLQDGGTIALDWVEEEPILPENVPIIIIVPTLTGCLRNSSRFCKHAFSRGYRCVLFNKRGHGNSILKTPKLQGFGETADLRQAVIHIHKEYPDACKIMVGSSAGSGLLVSYLGDYGSSAIVCASVTIAAGFDMVELFSKKLPWFYEFVLIFHLKQILQQNRKMLETVIDIKSAMSSWNFNQYDYHVYCKFGGQSSVLEYWKENNPMRNIENITVPILVINSLDDPVCVKENIPFKLLSEDENILLLTVEKGGHCGYLEGWNLKSKWTDKIVCDYFDAILKYQADNNT